MTDDHSNSSGAPAGAILAKRIKFVIEAIESAVKDIDQARPVHRARVAIRRAQMAVQCLALEHGGELTRAKKIGKRLKRLLRSAGAVRQLDVMMEWLAGEHSRADQSRCMALESALVWASEDRRDAAKEFTRRATRRSRGLRKAIGRIIGEYSTDVAEPASESSSLDAILLESADKLRSRAETELVGVDDVHQLRLRAKRMRYSVEAFQESRGDERVDELVERLVKLQDDLGSMNDAQERGRQIADYAKRIQAGTSSFEQGEASLLWTEMDKLAHEQQQKAQNSLNEFIADWNLTRRSELLSDLDRLVTLATHKYEPAVHAQTVDVKPIACGADAPLESAT
jgi:CHAD domain-containing protein